MHCFRSSLLLMVFCFVAGQLVGCGGGASTETGESGSGNAAASSDSGASSGGERVARFPMRSDGPKSLDPIRGSTVYENRVVSQMLETLLQYKYLQRPYELEPLLLSEMPTSSDDGLEWTFKLKPDVFFHDDPCFEDGKGRTLKASDVVYSWMRMADSRAGSKVWWLFQDLIVGFDDWRDEQNAAAEFNYDAPVPGLEVVDDLTLKVRLNKPAQSFLWKLAMFQTSIVPREAVEMYGDRFGLRPVGTGAFYLKDGDWKPDQGIRLTRNPNYHECYYPEEAEAGDEAEGFTKPAGKRLPFLDAVEVSFFKTDQPMWLKFLAGDLDYAEVPAENFKEAFNKRTRKLNREFADQGMRGYPVPLLDFIFRGFNMEDEVLGGYTEEKKKLRQAVCLALDWDEQNNAFYNDINLIYDGVIPPGLEGHPENGTSEKAYRGPDIPRAKQLLAEAGYPNGEGLPPLDYYTSRSQNGKEQSEMIRKQLSAIGVQVQIHIVDFSQLIQKVDEKSAQFFSFAWSSDYPDGENNLALFYGPNEAPGSNHFNYKRAEYDALYEQIVPMAPSAERTALYQQMQEMLMEDCPYAGSMARTRFYVVTDRLEYLKPQETFENWYKYVDIAD